MFGSRKSTQNLLDIGLPRPGQITNLRNSDNSHYVLNNQIGMTKSNVFSRSQLPQQLSFKPVQNTTKNSQIFVYNEQSQKFSFKDSTGGLKKYDTPTSAQSTQPQALIFKPKLAESTRLLPINLQGYSSSGKLSGDGSFQSKASQNEITVTNAYGTQSSNGVNKLQFKQPLHNNHNNTSSLPSGSPQSQGQINFRLKPSIHQALKESVGSNTASIKQSKDNQSHAEGEVGSGRLQKYRKKTYKDFSEHFGDKQPTQSYVVKINQQKLDANGKQIKNLKSIQQSNFKVTTSISGTTQNSHQNSEKKQSGASTPSAANFYYYSYPHPNFINPFTKESKNQNTTNNNHNTNINNRSPTNYLQYATPQENDNQHSKALVLNNTSAIEQVKDKPDRITPNSQNSNFSKFKNNSISPGKQSPNAKQKVSQRGVKLSDFKLGKKLGKGKFGDVFVAQDIRTGFVCALKIIKKKTLIDEKVDHQFIRELKIQFYLSHPKIVALYGFFDDETNFYMLLEYAVEGHLFGILKQKKRFKEQEAKTIVRQVCEGIEYMHSQRILHRDLKPQNILIQFGIPKICDFGWAIYRADTLRDTFCGTPLYISPQILTGEKYDESADLWAVGILTYELLIGKIPFKIRSQQDLIKIINEQIVFPEHVVITEVCKDFVMRMLERDVSNRYDIEQILNHAFLVQKQVSKPLQ